jgi:hypothetical protein
VLKTCIASLKTKNQAADKCLKTLIGSLELIGFQLEGRFLALNASQAVTFSSEHA